MSVIFHEVTGSFQSFLRKCKYPSPNNDYLSVVFLDKNGVQFKKVTNMQFKYMHKRFYSWQSWYFDMKPKCFISASHSSLLKRHVLKDQNLIKLIIFTVLLRPVLKSALKSTSARQMNRILPVPWRNCAQVPAVLPIIGFAPPVPLLRVFPKVSFMDL